MNAELFLLPVAAYLIGAVPFGFLIGKWYHIDIRKAGSGNIGATNVTRVVGRKAGKLCFFLDFVKGALPVILVTVFVPETPELALAAAIAAILGHIFPIYLKFKGGKGVSVGGALSLMLDWRVGLLVIACFLLGAFLSKKVSLGSVLGALAAGIGPFIFGVSGPRMVLGVVAMCIVVYRHKENIVRLIKGTEPDFKAAKRTKTKEN